MNFSYLSWRNYQGGLKAKIYKNDRLLIDLPGQCLSPKFYNERVYFIYDNGENGNIYSCNDSGSDLKQHTFYNDFYINNISLYKNEIAYSKLGYLGCLNLDTNESKKIDIDYQHLNFEKKQSINHSFITDIQSNDKNILMAIKGNIFEKKQYSGGFHQLNNDLRFTKVGYLSNNVAFSFKDGLNCELHIFNSEKTKIIKLESQKINEVKPSLKSNLIAYSNHKNEIYILNTDSEEQTLVSKSSAPISNFDWSSDESFLFFDYNKNNKSQIAVYCTKTKTNQKITNDIYNNYFPSIDPSGNFLVFLSNRDKKVKRDHVKFNLSFEVTSNSYYIPLKEGFSILKPWDNKFSLNETPCFDNISNKITKLPINEHILNIYASYDNKILYLNNKEELKVFDISSLKESTTYESINLFNTSSNKKNLTLLNTDNSIFICKIDEKIPDEGYQKNGEKVNQITSKTPLILELENIFDEFSWLTQEFFWNKNLKSNIKTALSKYKEYVKTVSTRAELESIILQMLGELKTSHAYLFKNTPESKKGKIAASFSYDSEKNKYKVDKIFDNTKEAKHPIYSYNAPIKEGDYIEYIDNNKISLDYSVDKALYNSKNNWITIKTEKNEAEVKTEPSQESFEYQHWVNQNKNHVQKQSNDIGYIHIIDMMEEGYSDFFEQYLDQYQKNSIIIDARYNLGGNISTLIIDQLNRKKAALDNSEYSGKTTLPNEASNKNYVLLINNHTASDGEIFTHYFKELKLGVVIGEKTWGGVIGMQAKYPLIDNTMFTKPEFEIKNNKKMMSIENNGVEPDIEVKNSFLNKISVENDKQLKEAIKECLKFKKCST